MTRKKHEGMYFTDTYEDLGAARLYDAATDTFIKRRSIYRRKSDGALFIRDLVRVNKAKIKVEFVNHYGENGNR